MEISDYFTGESQKEKIHGILEKTKVPYQGSWRKVFEQTYSQQTDNKEQTGTLENLFSIQNLKISFIGFVIVPVMCIYIFFPLFLLLVRGEVCNLRSPENPWVVKDRAVEQIIMRGWWFLMKTGFE